MKTEMKYSTLGKTGLRVSRMGFGGIPIQRAGINKATALFDALERAGVNYIDTARGYTVSESCIGHALRGRRDRFALATKSFARTKDAMAAEIDLSLSTLGVDYIDLYQIHNPSPEQLDVVVGENGALEALLMAKAAGKIGHIGLTAHSLAVFERALGYDWVETMMFPYNIVETQGEALIEECKKRDIGFIAMKPLAGGAITDASTALRFVSVNDGVSVVIPGMADEAEIEQNACAVCDGSPLSASELDMIGAVRAALGTNFCRRCGYCAPCTVGINIPSVFLFDGYLTRYSLPEWARERYSTLPVKASACIGCGVCETRCPYELPIRKMMREASERLDK